MSNSLRPHGLQYSRPPCPSPTHVHWVGDAIQPPHPLSSPSPLAFSLSQNHGLFQWVTSLHQVTKVWSFSSSPSNEYSGMISFRMDGFGSPCSPRDSQESSPAAQFESINSLMLLTSVHDYWKTIALTIRTFVCKVKSLLYNPLSRLVIASRPRSKCLLVSWLPSDFGVQGKSVTASTFSPSIYYEAMGPDAMILVFWMLNFKPTSSFSSLNSHQEAL